MILYPYDQGHIFFFEGSEMKQKASFQFLMASLSTFSKIYQVVESTLEGYTLQCIGLDEEYSYSDDFL